MIGTDSHTPNAGGLGMVAIGVGGGDAIDVMTGLPVQPALAATHRRATSPALSGWASPKDVILRGRRPPHRQGRHRAPSSSTSVPAPTPSAPPARPRSATWAPRSAPRPRCSPTTTTPPPTCGPPAARDSPTPPTLVAGDLRADPEVEADPERFFDRVIEIDLSDLVPHDQRARHPGPRPLPSATSALGARARRAHRRSRARWSARAPTPPTRTSPGPRSSPDRRRRAGLRAKTPLLVTPGSEQVRATIERDGLLADLEAIGATVLANACGPCIGQWDRQRRRSHGTRNTIVTSFNRNFPRRNDGNANTKSFVASPEIVVAMALAGTLDFDPVSDSIANRRGTSVRLEPRRRRVCPRRVRPGRARFFAAARCPDVEIDVASPTRSGSSC